ncbi:hypothetical protein ElyMa_005280500 [Elysia marginata]|uniref:Uncharacterized protein n=1 Tax=Elysia marginata TaxID=1093978 RepID=A0AAV4JZ41_9GAST|nr:hypothetical protein ElyMa_005280500 [Elysia marginata]
MLKIIGVLRLMVLTVQPHLQVIQQLFDWIKVRQKCWPWQNLAVALLKKVLSVSGCVSSCVVLLKNNISMHGGVRHHVSLKHILHVCLRTYGPSIVEKTGPILSLQEIAPHIIKDAPPRLSCSLTQSACYLSPLLLRTRTRPPEWSMQNRDSSLNTTLRHWMQPHAACSWAHSVRWCR